MIFQGADGKASSAPASFTLEPSVNAKSEDRRAGTPLSCKALHFSYAKLEDMTRCPRVCQERMLSAVVGTNAAGEWIASLPI